MGEVMSRLSEQEACSIAWEFLRLTQGARRLENCPRTYLMSQEEQAQLGLGGKTEWLVSFPLKVPRALRDEDLRVGVIVDDASGECELMKRVGA
jgi:hypothetical protein